MVKPLLAIGLKRDFRAGLFLRLICQLLDVYSDVIELSSIGIIGRLVTEQKLAAFQGDLAYLVDERRAGFFGLGGCCRRGSLHQIGEIYFAVSASLRMNFQTLSFNEFDVRLARNRLKAADVHRQ